MSADMKQVREELARAEADIRRMESGPARDAVIRLTKVMRQIALMVSLSEPVIDMERTSYRDQATYEMGRAVPGADFSRFKGGGANITGHSQYKSSLGRLLRGDSADAGVSWPADDRFK